MLPAAVGIVRWRGPLSGNSCLHRAVWLRAHRGLKAPGRVNLIGDHTDYNEGFVLPLALSFDTVIAAQPVSGRRIEAHSKRFGSTRFEINADPFRTAGWGRYLHATIALLQKTGMAGRGWRGCIASDIPAGASLSTSAAAAMKAKDSSLLGRLMTSSHVSLRDNYQVSGPALDRIVEIALEARGCLGAHMTGGGFAGCAVALVRSSLLKPFCEQVASEFVTPDGQHPSEPSRYYVVEASAGASVQAFK